MRASPAEPPGVAVRRSAHDGEPEVIIVHGALDRAATFVPTQRLLAPLPVTLYDRRGYGRSVALAPAQDLSQHVADLLGVADGRPVVVVGHSFGGLVALAAAVAAPEQVRAVGVYEPPMPWLDTWPTTVRRLADDPEGAVERFFRAVAGNDTWERLPVRFQDARRAEGPALLSDIETADAGLSFDLADVLSPVAAAHGSVTSPQYAASARSIAEQVYGAQLTVIEGASHGVHLTHADAFAAWIREVVALAC